MTNRNPIARDLRTPKYRKRVVKPKKGKGSFSRKTFRSLMSGGKND